MHGFSSSGRMWATGAGIALLAVIVLFASAGLSRAGMAATPTATPDPTLQPAREFSGGNADWTPVEREFDGRAMVLVPAGCFMMGSTDAQIEYAVDELGANPDWVSNEQPAHRVCFEEPFWIDKTEVTNAQYRACVEAGAGGESGACTAPQDTRYYDDPVYADYPVVFVDWPQARAYAEWAECSLPTEAQWEYAARGPDALVYPWGDTFAGDNVVYAGNASGTAPVGSKPGGVSWVGALDLSGNAAEWVADWYAADTYASLDDGVVNPTGPADGSARVLRGGAFTYFQLLARAPARPGYNPDLRDNSWGFRVVCARPPS
jgi:formylglycine-generating enzyme required for sulfatase activity